MGIKDFTKVPQFEPHKEISKIEKLKEQAPKIKGLVVDGNIEIHRASLGGPKVKTLTDANGNPTLHISVLLSNIMKYISLDIDQVWIFDFHCEDKQNDVEHIPQKEKELQKRKKHKEKAKKELEKLEKPKLKFRTVKDEDEVKLDEKKKSSLEKQSFQLTPSMFKDIEFILEKLGITYIEAPCGFESEQMAAMLTKRESEAKNILDIKEKTTTVLTSDSDALLFGAKYILKKKIRSTKYHLYKLKKLLKDNNLKLKDLQKIGLILGSDYAPKTKGVGPKTVLKKFNNIDLTDEQKEGLKQFRKKMTDKDIKKAKVYKSKRTKKSVQELLNWLISDKLFRKERWKKLMIKYLGPNYQDLT